MVKKHEEPENLEEELEELERKVDRLRVLFEQYFLGIEKRPPLALQKDVVRLMRRVGNYHIRRTASKFRYQSITQRFNVHRAYWARTMRQIEEGTFQRDRARAERREVARSGERLDAAELAKRNILRDMKGEAAVEARKRRLQRTDRDGDDRPDYIPAVARRRTIGSRRRSANDIRGIPAEQVVEQVAEEGTNGSPLDGDTERADGEKNSPTSRPRPSLPPSRAADSPPPVSARPSGQPEPAADGANERPRPSIVRRRTPPPREQPSRRAATAASSGAPGAGAAPARDAQKVLQNAGMPPDRARRIYNDWMNARQRAGQSTKGITYDRLVESMARQVPKLRESHGALRVDFEVVTKGDKVYLKPKAK